MGPHDDRGEGSRPGDDVLEHGRDRPLVPWWPSLRRRLPEPRWPSRPVAGLLVAAGLVVGLVAGLAAGYQAGDHRAARSLAPALPPAVSQAAQLADGGAPLAQGPACATRVNSDLQLGIEVTNVSASAVTLRQVRAILPIGGLRVVAHRWGPCGELPQQLITPTGALAPGGSVWFTVTFKVLISCPGPIPVQFALDYAQRGRAATARLPGFDDLTQVPYPGCS